MKSQQSGFTLVEIAIVLVIIGLLLGGILKGQELINSAKVKNLANDFRTIPTFIYGYQDKFKSLPGDDSAASTHINGATNATTGGTVGNGVVEGAWNSATLTDESILFWQHVRLANLAPGPTATADADYIPKNALGGKLGISSAATAQLQISGMSGTYQICSEGILGKFVKQLDVQMDDSNTAGGSMRAVAVGSALGTAAVATAAIDDATSYTVCYVF
ncbi:MAG: prepilin-type N-terminal cleavage/methylation domain-containing protein [Betaproteobacteria bacterium]|nr:prepilin-type N-terminal cleavage/methylation domain-containing protein [Betaproteobacteria bacterium]